MGYEVEIELKDGTPHRYEGDTRDGRMIDDNFGHDGGDIVRREWEITDYYDNN